VCQVTLSDKPKVLDQAIAMVNKAGPADAKRMARIILSAVNADNGEEYADRIFLLNLALGNTHEAITHVADSAIKDSQCGQYKVCHCI
jgi:hypothetical protein